jgi:hypothetical protein
MLGMDMNGAAKPAIAAVLITVRRVVRRSVTSEIDFDTALSSSMSHDSPARDAERAKFGRIWQDHAGPGR